MQLGVPAAVELLEGPIGWSRSALLVQQVQLVVAPSHGEQWALPVLQAMALGTPVIGTNWSGVHEHLSSLNGFPLSVERLVSRTVWMQSSYQLLMCQVPAAGLSGVHQWAEPNTTEMAAIMRQSFEAQDETRCSISSFVVLEKMLRAAGYWAYVHAFLL